MSDSDERLRAPPRAGLRLKQNFLYNSFLRAPPIFSYKGKGNFAFGALL